MFKSFSCDSLDSVNCCSNKNGGNQQTTKLSHFSYMNDSVRQQMPNNSLHYSESLSSESESLSVGTVPVTPRVDQKSSFFKLPKVHSQSLIDLSKLNCLPRWSTNRRQLFNCFNRNELRFDRSKLPPIDTSRPRRRRGARSFNNNLSKSTYFSTSSSSSSSSETSTKSKVCHTATNSHSTLPAKRQNPHLKMPKYPSQIEANNSSNNRQSNNNKHLVVSRFENDDYDYLINCTDLITTCQEALQENNHFDAVVDDCRSEQNLHLHHHHHHSHHLDGSMLHHLDASHKQSFDECNVSVRSPSSAASSGLGLSLEEDSSLKYCHSDEEFSSLNSATTESNLLGSISPICPNSSSSLSCSPVLTEDSSLPTGSTTTSSYSVKTLFAEFIEWLDYIEDKLESTCYCAKIDLSHAPPTEEGNGSNSIYSLKSSSLNLMMTTSANHNNSNKNKRCFDKSVLGFHATSVATFKNDADSQDQIGNVIKSVLFDNNNPDLDNEDEEDDPDLDSDVENDDKEQFFNKYQQHCDGLALYGSKKEQCCVELDQEEADREAEEWLMSLPPETTANVGDEGQFAGSYIRSLEQDDSPADWNAIFASHKALQNEIEKVSNRFLKEIRELTRQPDCGIITESSSSSSSNHGLSKSLCQQEERCKRLWLTSLEYLIILEGTFGQRCPRHFNLNHHNSGIECNEENEDDEDENNDCSSQVAQSQGSSNQLTPTNDNNGEENHSEHDDNSDDSCSNLNEFEFPVSDSAATNRARPPYNISGNNQLLSRSYNSIFSSAKYTKLFRLFNHHHNNNSNSENSATPANSTPTGVTIGASAISTQLSTIYNSNISTIKSTIELRSTGIGDSSITQHSRRVQTHAQQQQQQQQKQQPKKPMKRSGRKMTDQEPITDTHSLDGSGSPGADSGVFSSSTEKYEIIQKDIGYSSDADMSDAIEVHPHSSDQLISQRSARKNKVRRRRTRTNRPRPWSYHADWTDWDYYQTPFSANGDNASQEDMLGYDNEHVVRRLTEFGENYETWINTDLALDADEHKAALKPPVVIEKPEIEAQLSESPTITRRASYQDACTSPIPLFIEEPPEQTATVDVAVTANNNNNNCNENKFTQTKSKLMVDSACMATSTKATGKSVNTQTKKSNSSSTSISSTSNTSGTSASSSSSVSKTCCKNCSRQVATNSSSKGFSSFKFYSSLAIAGLFAIFFAVTQFSPEIHKTYSRPPPL